MQPCRPSPFAYLAIPFNQPFLVQKIPLKLFYFGIFPRQLVLQLVKLIEKALILVEESRLLISRRSSSASFCARDCRSPGHPGKKPMGELEPPPVLQVKSPRRSAPFFRDGTPTTPLLGRQLFRHAWILSLPLAPLRSTGHFSHPIIKPCAIRTRPPLPVTRSPAVINRLAAP